MFRATHETSLLRTRLDRILGEDATRLSKNDARRAMSFILAEGSSHSDVDREKTILLSSSVPSSPKIGDDPLPEPEETRDCSMDVDDFAVGGGHQAAVASPPSENLLERNTQEAIQSSKRHELACEDYRHHDNQLDDQPVVDRKRLVEIITAEERINIMVNHLGSSDTAWLGMHSRYSPPPKGTRTGSAEILNVAVGIPPLSLRGAGTANEARAYTCRNEGEFVSSPKRLMRGDSVTCGMAHGPRGTDSHRKKKKSKSKGRACVGDSGQRQERGTLGGNFEQPGTGMSMLSRSASSAVGQESLPEPVGGENTGPCSSLPRLNVSRLNG